MGGETAGDDGAPEVTPESRVVAAASGAPDFILPWLDRFYDADDVDLLQGPPAAPSRALPRRGSSAPSAAPS